MIRSRAKAGLDSRQRVYYLYLYFSFLIFLVFYLSDPGPLYKLYCGPLVRGVTNFLLEFERMKGLTKLNSDINSVLRDICTVRGHWRLINPELVEFSHSITS